jgi:hypothetical protein
MTASRQLKLRRNRRGAPFVPYTDYSYLGRKRENGLPGPRKYLVNVDGQSRIYFYVKSVPCWFKWQKIKLLKCDQSDCSAIGYIFKDVVYLYGHHNQ